LGEAVDTFDGVVRIALKLVMRLWTPAKQAGISLFNIFPSEVREHRCISLWIECWWRLIFRFGADCKDSSVVNISSRNYL